MVVYRTYDLMRVFIKSAGFLLGTADGAVYENMLKPSRSRYRRERHRRSIVYEEMIVPSCMETMRSAWAESLSLCVTITKVVPRERFN